MRAELGVVVVALSVGAAHAQVTSPPDVDWGKPPALAAERPFQPPGATRLALEGGGALLVVENHALPLVTVLFAMPGAGSAADPPGRTGLAAFTANLLEEGAGGLSAREVAEQLENLGSEIATWVEDDAGFVRVTALTQKLGPSLDITGKVLAAPAFAEGDARRTHEDQATAIKLRRDQPGAVAQVIFDGALFGPDSPHGHPTLGSARDFARVGVADARAFYRDRWATSRLLAVVAGDVTPAEAKQHIDRALAGWKQAGGAAPPAPASVITRAPPARLLVVDRRDAEQANVIVGATGIRRDDPDAYPLEVLLNLLGGTYSSRLNHRLREELGYTYGIGASSSYFRDGGTISFSSALATPTAPDGLRELLRIVGETTSAAVPAAELAATQQNLVRGLPLYFANNEDIVDAFAGAVLVGLPDDWFDGYAARVRAVTAEQVQAAARRLVAAERLVAVVVGPMATLEKPLAKLGFGKPRRYDPDGLPVKR